MRGLPARTCARQHLPGLLFLLACLGLATADIFWGFWDHDSGFYLNQSAMIAAGLKPFVDFVTIYPPLFNVLNAIPMVFGVEPWALVWMTPLFWICANTALTIVYLRGELAGQWPAWAVWAVGGAFALFCIDSGGNHVTLEHGVVFFGIASLIAFRARAPWQWLGVGASIACAVLSKQVGVLLLIPFVTQLRTWRQAGELALGFFLPILGFLAWLHFDIESIARSVQALRAYVDVGTSDAWILFVRFFGVSLADLTRAPWIIIFLAACWGLGVYGIEHLLKERELRRAAWLGSWVLIGLMYFGARAKNNFPHYSINCWPALLVVMAACWNLVPPTVYRRFFQAATMLSLGLMIVFSSRLHDIQGRPYFTRWEGEGRIFFLRRIAEELRRNVPAEASVTHLGMEESVILFMAGRLPRNKDWGAYDQVAPIEGDAILFTDYGQRSADRWKIGFRQKGYVLVRSWPSPEWGTVQVYWR
jgi:hypothetical protein